MPVGQYFAIVVAVISFIAGTAARAAPLTVDTLLQGARIQDVALTPDGKFIAVLTMESNVSVVRVIDRSGKLPAKTVLRDTPKEQMRPKWCAWANNQRLVCSFQGLQAEAGKFFPISRLVAVDADGSNIMVLLRWGVSGQLQDRIVDWTPNDPDNVLIELDDDFDGYPAVFKLNVRTGRREVHIRQRDPIRTFAADHQGNIRLGWGTRDQKVMFFGRLDNQRSWKELNRVDAFDTADVFEPVAVIAGTNFAYAMRDKNGRSALWKIDLEDERDPELVYANDEVDLSGPVLAPDGRLFGVSYQTDKPQVYYVDDNANAVVKAVDRLLPDRTNRIVDMSLDGLVYLVHSEGDMFPSSYYVADRGSGSVRLERIGSVAPAVMAEMLSPMKPIEFPARDDTWIPGYLTLPAGGGSKPPLIVMPHGGPYARDVWGFDPWVQFLASRGYAVLQMNFRGSTGYGSAWLKAGFQDWGGLPYSDVIDGTQWAIERGYADPERVCIVGASYGGYLALAAATREAKLFRCAVSIAGVSDLPELLRDNQSFINWQISNASVGTDWKKLKADSPRNHAETLNIPLLMIHGDRDYTVEVDQTRMMATALKRAGKNFKVSYVAGADHYFSDDPYTHQLLTELDQFLQPFLQKPPGR